MTPLGIHPTVDFVFKLIFGRPECADVLMDLLNAILTPDASIVDVEILNPFNEKDFDDDKLSIVDIKARDSGGNSYVIEIQTTVPSGLKRRLVYYASLLFAGQMREGMRYTDMQPAICICLLTQQLFSPETVVAGHTRFVLHDAKHKLDLIDDLQVHLVELPKYNVQADSISQATAMEQWAFFLKQADQCDAEALRTLLPGPAFTKATGVLEMVSRTPDLRAAHDSRVKAEWDRFSELEDARVEGREEGQAKGELIGQIKLLQRLLKEPVAEKSGLNALSDEKLTQLVDELQQRLQARS